MSGNHTDPAGCASPQGLDLHRVRTWLDREHPGMVHGPLQATLITGGKSNLTYTLTDGHHEWIVRRPPLGQIMATAHDMKREFTIASALRDTDVPVAAMYAFCQDDSVIGAPFYVMERVQGVPYRYAHEIEPLGEKRVQDIAHALIQTLVTLHRVDPQAVGLGELGRPQGFLTRQVGRWKKQLDASKTRDLPGADELYAKLASHVPAESGAGIVHGDFRLDNVLMAADDTPAAVIDWELATLGDPLMDLALMLIYQRRARILTAQGKVAAAEADVTTAQGYPSEEELMDLYEQLMGRPLNDFGFRLGLACFKLAGISEGVRYRALNGQMVGEGFENAGHAVPLLIELGLESMKEYQ